MHIVKSHNRERDSLPSHKYSFHVKKCANIGQKSHCLQEKLSRKSFTALFCKLLVGHEPKSFLKRLDGVVFIRS